LEKNLSILTQNNNLGNQKDNNIDFQGKHIFSPKRGRKSPKIVIITLALGKKFSGNFNPRNWHQTSYKKLSKIHMTITKFWDLMITNQI
jgi:hypothetical protein